MHLQNTPRFKESLSNGIPFHLKSVEHCYIEHPYESAIQKVVRNVLSALEKKHWIDIICF